MTLLFDHILIKKKELGRSCGKQNFVVSMILTATMKRSKTSNKQSCAWSFICSHFDNNITSRILCENFLQNKTHVKTSNECYN
jgi:hypothetical protein